MSEREPTRDDVEAWRGEVVLEFGASWCPICQGARPLIDRVLRAHPDARHVWVEDGKGKKLGRTFGVKLWPTLVVMRDGVEVGRVVRPQSPPQVEAAFASAPSASPAPSAVP